MRADPHRHTCRKAEGRAACRFDPDLKPVRTHPHRRNRGFGTEGVVTNLKPDRPTGERLAKKDIALILVLAFGVVGLGVMGFHSFLQARGLPFEGAMAKSWNLKIFKHVRAQVDTASMMLAQERGPCPDAADMGVMERFSCKMAIAPTASISIIAGGTSACIEPIPANIYTHKTLSGSFSIKNPYLEKLLSEKSKNSDAVWNSILEQGGSVAHLDFLTTEEKDVYKTSFEIDQRWLLELAADRTPFIDQATSLNLFIPADVDKWDLLMLHFRAWELGIKSLYYLRSKSVQRAGFAGGVEADNTAEPAKYELPTTDYDECLACQ